MTHNEQRIAIAKVCGWTAEQDSNGWWRARHKLTGNAVELWLSERNVWSVGIPDYLGDLNAMHEAEQVLFCDKWKWLAYVNNLNEMPSLQDEWLCVSIHATAPQRAQAFLRTLGLRQETSTQPQ